MENGGFVLEALRVCGGPTHTVGVRKRMFGGTESSFGGRGRDSGELRRAGALLGSIWGDERKRGPSIMVGVRKRKAGESCNAEGRWRIYEVVQ